MHHLLGNGLLFSREVIFYLFPCLIIKYSSFDYASIVDLTISNSNWFN